MEHFVIQSWREVGERDDVNCSLVNFDVPPLALCHVIAQIGFCPEMRFVQLWETSVLGMSPTHPSPRAQAQRRHPPQTAISPWLLAAKNRFVASKTRFGENHILTKTRQFWHVVNIDPSEHAFWGRV